VGRLKVVKCADAWQKCCTMEILTDVPLKIAAFELAFTAVGQSTPVHMHRHTVVCESSRDSNVLSKKQTS
jgi:hypothetical protein